MKPLNEIVHEVKLISWKEWPIQPTVVSLQNNLTSLGYYNISAIPGLSIFLLPNTQLAGMLSNAHSGQH